MIEGSAPTTGRSADVPETQTDGLEVLETREWLDSLDYVLYKGGPDRAGRLLQQLSLHARRQAGVNLPFTATTPYQNTIASRQQPPFPGSQEMERRIRSEEHTSELQSRLHLVCRLLLEKKKNI